ncbi:MAG: hypothetical protein PUD04_02685 [Firmicutes bacterium]|nr:hypothetical protein [Bacillota bacterium]
MRKNISKILPVCMAFVLAASGTVFPAEVNAAQKQTKKVTVSTSKGKPGKPSQPVSKMVPVLQVTSNLNGSAYTNGKSTLKSALNTTVDYEEDSKAVLTLTMPNGSAVDDKKIDSSNAKVELVEGDGYYPSEYKFLATKLTGTWSNGKLEYRLSKGDLELDLDQYPNVDANSGREWSCLGGDGHGNYTFNLKVSGIRYNGKEIASQEFKVHILIYGYNYTSDAISLYTENGTPAIEAEFVALSDRTDAPKASKDPVWTWIGDGEMPILCDNYADDFYITWPAKVNASSVKSKDVSITLKNDRGDERRLTADKDFKVNSEKDETQIALIYQNWAFTPVYTKMTISVNKGKAKAEKTYDIGSVYVYEAQQGGGGTTIDGTVTAYSFYGLANLTDWRQIFGAPSYLLRLEQDGQKLYYAEDEDGNGSLTLDAAEAKLFDASGEQDRNPQLVGNTVYVTTRTVLKEVEKIVDGETVTLKQYYPGWNDGINAGGSLLTPMQCDPELKAASGYVIPWNTSNWITNEKWAWQKGVEEGWTGITVSPYKGKFEWNVALGDSQQFEATLNDEPVDVTWEIFGDVAEGTTVTQDGLVTVDENETQAQFAVTVTAEDGTKGTVTIKVTK